MDYLNENSPESHLLKPTDFCLSSTVSKLQMDADEILLYNVRTKKDAD